MIPRRISFSKVFTGYDLVEESVQKYVGECFLVSLRQVSALDFPVSESNFLKSLGHFIWYRKTNMEESLPIVSTPNGTDSTSPSGKASTTMSVQRMRFEGAPTFCSGFTASVMVLCFQLVEEMVTERYPHLKTCFQLHPNVRTDAVNYTPRDLHRWAVWEDEPVPPMEFERYLHPDVVASRRIYSYV